MKQEKNTKQRTKKWSRNKRWIRRLCPIVFESCAAFFTSFSIFFPYCCCFFFSIQLNVGIVTLVISFFFTHFFHFAILVPVDTVYSMQLHSFYNILSKLLTINDCVNETKAELLTKNIEEWKRKNSYICIQYMFV